MDGDQKRFWQDTSKNGRDRPRVARLKARLERLLREVATVEVELSRAEGAIRGVPHYSAIEDRAHSLGMQLSRQVQQQQMNELAAVSEVAVACPTCQASCRLASQKRPVKSVDGEVELQELVAYCSRCRRSFFPSA